MALDTLTHPRTQDAASLSKVPSAATVSFARFVFDIGLMLCQRTMFARLLPDWPAAHPGLLLMGMTDSSPVGGTSWQNTSFVMVKGEDVAAVGRASIHLAHQRRDDADGDTEHEASLRQCMRDGMRTCMAPCCGLGSRRAGLGHKLHAIWHQVFLMTGTPPLLHRFCRAVSTWTVDLGVEASVNRVHPVPFDGAFPYLVRECADAPAGYWETPIDFSGSVVVYGGMHMTSKMMEGLLAASASC